MFGVTVRIWRKAKDTVYCCIAVLMMLFSVVIGVWVSCTDVMNSRRNQKKFVTISIRLRFPNISISRDYILCLNI